MSDPAEYTADASASLVPVDDLGIVEGEVVNVDGTRCILCNQMINWDEGHTCRANIRRA